MVDGQPNEPDKPNKPKQPSLMVGFNLRFAPLTKKLKAAAIKDAKCLDDVLNISLTYQNGSIGTISYVAMETKAGPIF